MSFFDRYLSDPDYRRSFINLIIDELAGTTMLELELHVLNDRVLTRNEMGTFPRHVWREVKELVKFHIYDLDHKEPLLPQLKKLDPDFSADKYAPDFSVVDVSSIYED